MSGTVTRTAVGHGGEPFSADLPLMVVTPALFAANMVAARWAESAAIPPLFLAFGRWALTFILILPFVAPRLWQWRQVLLANWPRLVLLATLGMGVAVGPQYIGARTTSAANIALIFAACPALVALIEMLVWQTPVGKKRAYGMVLAICGILVVLSKGEGLLPKDLAFNNGDLWILLAACGWAFYTTLSKRCSLPTLPGMVKLVVLAGAGALALAPFALLEAVDGLVPDFQDGRLYALLGFLAVVPGLGAYFCFDRLVGLVGASGASVSMYMIPVFATLAAWPLLGEAPNAVHLAGFALILGGVMLSSRQKQ